MSTVSKNNCSISLLDLTLPRLRTAEETVELFGEDYLEEYGYSIDPALLQRYVEVKKEFLELSEQLEAIAKKGRP